MAACALYLAGCEQGRVTVAITDAPVDEARRIVVEFGGIELESMEEGAQVIEFDPPRQIDLLAIPAGQTAVLIDAELLPIGNYSVIRLRVNAEESAADSTIELNDGRSFPLQLAEADRAGLTVSHPFELSRNADRRFTIDFDLRRSVEPPAEVNGDYVLRPVLRLVDDEEAGRIAGAVAFSRIATGCTAAIYVFEGRDAEPDDVDSGSTGPGPLTSARVEFDSFSGLFRYTTAPLPEGDYTVAFTCDTASDDPTSDDALDFPVTLDVTVQPGETVPADIPG